MARRLPHDADGVARLGIDVGGVLAIDTDTASGTKALALSMQGAPPTAECVEAVAQLVAHFGPENVFILSKCGIRMQQATVVWLNSYNFFEKTGKFQFPPTAPTLLPRIAPE
eukprot:SAG31_NODE_5282_length_2633_cov_2.549329_1_plen_112_part_00